MPCDAPLCDSLVYARGHCSRHYRQLLRRGTLRPEPVVRDCAVEGCGRAAVTRSWCHGHYLRWSRQGDVRADVPLTRPARDHCEVQGCARGAHSAGLCRSHARRLRLYGDPAGGRPARTSTGGGCIKNGYWWVAVGPTRRHLVPPGRVANFEHRLVMAASLGRPLTDDETVHHLNGDRLDNRLVNLELWSTAQPKGQRVADKLAFAYELLRRYDAEAWRALGCDLDPDTGLPDDERPGPEGDAGLSWQNCV